MLEREEVGHGNGVCIRSRHSGGDSPRGVACPVRGGASPTMTLKGASSRVRQSRTEKAELEIWKGVSRIVLPKGRSVIASLSNLSSLNVIREKKEVIAMPKRGLHRRGGGE